MKPVTLGEAMEALAFLGKEEYYIYEHKTSNPRRYEVRHKPKEKTEAQKEAMKRTPQHERLEEVSNQAAVEYNNPEKRAEWEQRWKEWRQWRMHSKKDPNRTDEGTAIKSVWAFILYSLHQEKK